MRDDDFKCPHCKKTHDLSAVDSEGVEDLLCTSTDQDGTFEVDCPGCEKPLSLYVDIEFTREVYTRTEAVLTEADKKYVEWKDQHVPPPTEGSKT